MRRMVAAAGVALACGFALTAPAVAANWLDQVTHARGHRQSYDSRAYRQYGGYRGYQDRQTVRRPTTNSDRGANVGKNFGGPS